MHSPCDVRNAYPSFPAQGIHILFTAKIEDIRELIQIEDAEWMHHITFRLRLVS